MHEQPYALIPLRAGKGPHALRPIVAYAKVDLDREDWANQWRWHRNEGGYAVRHTTHVRDGRRIYGTYRMARELLGLGKGDRRQVDHINRDRLDNRLSNLRIGSHRFNGQNIERTGGTSSYRGVCWDKDLGKWRAYAHLEGRINHLGVFVDEEEAAAVAAAFRLKHMPFATS